MNNSMCMCVYDRQNFEIENNGSRYSFCILRRKKNLHKIFVQGKVVKIECSKKNKSDLNKQTEENVETKIKILLSFKLNFVFLLFLFEGK